MRKGQPTGMRAEQGELSAFVPLTGVSPGMSSRGQDSESGPAVATACLRREHQLIVRVLECFEHVLSQARSRRRVSKDEFQPFIEFFAEYLVGCHRAKEEQCLFRCLVESHGFSEDEGPIHRLVYEHEAGRQRVSLMAANLDEAAAGQRHAVRLFLEQARAFRDILRGHVGAENQGLFNTADQLIPPGHPDHEVLRRSSEETDHNPANSRSVAHGQELGRQILTRYVAEMASERRNTGG